MNRKNLTEAIGLARPNLSKGSLKTYTSILSSLARKLEFEDIDDFKSKPDKVLEEVEKLPLHSSRKTTLSGLFVLTGVQAYREAMMESQHAVQEQYRNQEVSENRREQFQPLSEIHNKARELIIKVKQNPSFDNFTNAFLAIACTGIFEQLPPRRIKDWYMMKIRNFDKKTDNYIGTTKAVFNQFKTVDRHGPIAIELPREFLSLLAKYKKGYTGEWLLVTQSQTQFTQSALSHRVRKLFGASMDVLRSIYISNLYKGLPAIRELERTAEMMGHDMSTAISSYVKPVRS